MKRAISLSLFLVISCNVFSQDPFCNLLKQIINDAKTQFGTVKGKLLNEGNGIKDYESPYKLNGESFGVIKNSKEEGIFNIVK
ncbi:MAG: hypothetical protein ABI581_08735 [Sediminibacterium sp.]